MKESDENLNVFENPIMKTNMIPKNRYSLPIKKLNKKAITICWCFTIVSWITLIIFIYLCIKKKGFEYFSFGVFLLFYLIYFIFEIIYSISYFKSAVFTIDEFSNYIIEILKKPIQVNVSIHYENKTKINKIILNYYSLKDISGLFILDIDRTIEKNLSFLNLSFLLETNIADEVSFRDYLLKIFLLRKKHKLTDCHVKINEQIKGFLDNHFIYLKKNCKNFILNKFFLCIAIIFTFIEIIKYIIETSSFKQTFKIRKLISFREDLNKDKYYLKYQKYNPLIIIKDKIISFDKNETVLLIKENYLGEPNEEEIEKSQIFSYKIKKFDIQDLGFESGIVKDKYKSRKEKHEQRKVEEKISYEINKDINIVLSKQEFEKDKHYLKCNMNISLRTDDTRIELSNNKNKEINNDDYKEKILISSNEDSIDNSDYLIERDNHSKHSFNNKNVINTDSSRKRI